MSFLDERTFSERSRVIDANEPQSATMGFLNHVEELRKRLLRSLVAILLVAVVALIFGDEVLRIFMWPLGDVKLHFTEISGSFVGYMKVALFVAILGASPYVFAQLWGFVAPGLFQRERRLALTAIALTTLLFLTGAAFCFTIVLPFTIQYLVNFESALFTPIITLDSYISFAGWTMVGFGAGFTMPVWAYFAARMGLVTARGLAGFRRYALVIILFLAAILTPSPDVISQLSMAIPLYLLYEVSVVVAWLAARE